jgi:hypothetical protein
MFIAAETLREIIPAYTPSGYHVLSEAQLERLIRHVRPEIRATVPVSVCFLGDEVSVNIGGWQPGPLTLGLE